VKHAQMHIKQVKTFINNNNNKMCLEHRGAQNSHSFRGTYVLTIKHTHTHTHTHRETHPHTHTNDLPESELSCLSREYCISSFSAFWMPSYGPAFSSWFSLS